MPPNEFNEVFSVLRAILKPYAKSLCVSQTDAEGICFGRCIQLQCGKELLFASAQVKKNYVSFTHARLLRTPTCCTTSPPR